ncbi:GDP-mannose 4,6-dehydratase [Pseudoalteromonas sp. SR44-5]|uniref:GDP-mannose 4,6-dehydratase n=1 Tax=Pseudoalteromonas TaxID=53246 RepID=UPI0016033A8F|nr:MULTISPECIES: GDP-mannose 4,6-dehydratase [unclassified Pseudoalteromonas]MBB1332992.1 GDP-mannose 4,6-dehydratase [Pseudoalteromonas sp. SR41-6]MBB1366738.1 GDP-mannose 4,6-dehydratase [Pseudoalteromonas sp. SR44-5]MBB1416947.1 GDP-mannose 4,6-dehydratase [Pseudoalteromonas sp. SG44-1]MBB1458235.1 GDP-mannose 4,6-dehydratase [Pseudoalteromonas sp. SG41-8]
MNDSSILVLGSNSFSGASFCAHMLKNEQQIIAVSRSPEPNSALLPYSWQKNADKLQFSQLDINHHLQKIIDIVKQKKIKKIYNFAAQSMVGQSWQYPEHWFMTNTVSTIKLHNSLRQLDFLEKYIHISTPEVYGSCNGLVPEHTNYQPSTPYAVSRAAADMSLHTFADVYDFPVVFTRAANVYGEGQQLYRIIPRTILYALLGKKLQLHGGGHSTRSFIHIDDVSSATQLIGEKGKNGDIYHISTDKMISIRVLVETICNMLKLPFEQVCQSTEDRLGKDAAYLLDTKKIRSELNWQDSISLENGLERTIYWMKQNLDVLAKQEHDYIHKP